jgi:hypothetical protein
MTRTLIAFAAGAMSIIGATTASAQALYIEDGYAPPMYTAPPIFAAPPVYAAPPPDYVAPPAYAMAPPVVVSPAPGYIPHGYANGPRMVYDSRGYAIARYGW